MQGDYHDPTLVFQSRRHAAIEVPARAISPTPASAARRACKLGWSLEVLLSTLLIFPQM